MKKFISFSLVLLISSVFVFGQQATIKEMTGTVEVKAPGATVWTPAKSGMVIAKDASISTGFKSNAVIAVGESVITVKALTRLSLEEIIQNQGNETVALNIQSGRIRTQVNPPSGGRTDFTVRSPTATASVRGTEFEFDTVNLSVTDGQVHFVSPSGSTAAVRQGETSNVNEVTLVIATPRDAAAEHLTPQLPIGKEDYVSGSGGVQLVSAEFTFG